MVSELVKAPAPVRELLESISERFVERVEITEAVLELSEAYLAARVVGRKSLNDTIHVAAATLSRADAIVSWNFEYIVHLERMKRFNQVNLLEGYGILTMISPRDAGEEENGDEDETL